MPRQASQVEAMREPDPGLRTAATRLRASIAAAMQREILANAAEAVVGQAHQQAAEPADCVDRARVAISIGGER